MRKLVWLFGFLLPVLAAAEGGTVGNGGDGFAAEFTLTAQTASQLLQKAPLSDVPEFNLNAFIGAISSTKVNSQEVVKLDGVEVDAINYPDQHKIVMSRNRWTPLRSEAQTVPRFLLVIHEYLWMSGVDDTNYRISKRLISKLSPSKFSTRSWWTPANPTNLIAVSFYSDGCSVASGSWIFDFDLRKDIEVQERIIDPSGSSCASREKKRIMRVHKKTGYFASGDGLKGTFHSFDVVLMNEKGDELGRINYRPREGQCLVTPDLRCSQSGEFHIENVYFNFAMEKPPLDP